jgi:hypothetical protein
MVGIVDRLTRAGNSKSEIRSTKQIQNSKRQMIQTNLADTIRHSTLMLWCLFRISCCGFRASAAPAILLLVAVISAGGCGPGGGNLPKTVPAMGVVTLDGKPVEGAQVVLVPPAGAGAKGAYAVTNSSGHFALRAYEEKEGAIPGEYKVQVSKTVEEKLPGAKGSVDGGDPVRYVFGVPKKYTGFETSGLSISIPDAGKRDIKLELTSK